MTNLFYAKTIEDINKAIDSGANINFQDSLYKKSFLHILVQKNSSLLDYFLTKKPNPNVIDIDGKTPLFYCKNVQTVEKLIKNGAYVFIKDNKGKKVFDCIPEIMTEYIKIHGKKHIN